jgi:hypothetical protein
VKRFAFNIRWFEPKLRLRNRDELWAERKMILQAEFLQIFEA